MVVMIIATCAAVAVGLALYLNPKKSLNHLKKEIKAALEFQFMGAGGVADDYVQSWRNKFDDVPDMTGKVAVITGGARGIGVEVVKRLLQANMTVLMGIRRPELVKELAKSMKNGENLQSLHLDLRSLKSVKLFAENISRKHAAIHLLVNNGGIMFGDFNLTEDGVESQLAVNYLSHFYLTHWLLPLLKKGGDDGHPSRIVNVSSCAHYMSTIDFDDINMKNEYVTGMAYGQSKLAQIMFTRYLNDKLENEGENVRCYSVHPGIVNTGIFENTLFKHFSFVMRLFFKTPAQGATSVTYACFETSLDKQGGLYIANCREGYTNTYSKSREYQIKLFDKSCEMIGIETSEFGQF